MKKTRIIFIILLLIVLLPVSFKAYGYITYKLDKKKGKIVVEEYFNKFKCSYAIENIRDYKAGSWIAGYTKGFTYEVKGCNGEQYRVFFNTGTRDVILNGPGGSFFVIKTIK